MMKQGKEKHNQSYPTARKIKRACNKELYRTIKKLKIYLTPEQITKAEQLYLTKVTMHLQWLAEHESNRKAQADWWAEHVAPETALLWNVDVSKLATAFRDSYGG